MKQKIGAAAQLFQNDVASGRATFSFHLRGLAFVEKLDGSRKAARCLLRLGHGEPFLVDFFKVVHFLGERGFSNF